MSSPIVEKIGFQGQTLVISCATPELRQGIGQLYSPLPPEVAPAPGRPITCDFHLAPQDEFDRVLPIPREATFRPGSGLILGERIYPESRWEGPGRVWWRQYNGLGRQFWDLDRLAYRAVFTPQAFGEHLPLRYLYAVIALSTFFRAQGLVPVHAGCVVLGGRGLLLSAESGGGKSTTSLVLAQSGHPLLTDERIFLRAVGTGRFQAATLSDVVKVSRSTMERFVPKLKASEALCEHSGDLYFKLSCCGLSFQAQTPVAAMCSLKKTGQEETRWAPMPKARAVIGLFPVTMPLEKPTETRLVFEFLMDLLKAVPCYEVGLGTNPARMVRAFEDLAARIQA